MERRQLGRAEVEVSRVILGCGNFGGIGSAPEFFGGGETRDEAFALMGAAWELGVTSFDTADAYGGGRSEAWIGEWMRTTGNRPTITTKTFNPMATGEDHGLSPGRIERQLASSLERLGVDGVEVYLAHDFDPETPIAETIGAFEALLERGRIKAYGVSNFDAEQLRAALAIGRPAVVQNSFSLLDRDDGGDVLPLCREHGVAYTAFSPLAGGWLAGRYRRDQEPPADSRMATRPEPYRHLWSDPTFDSLDAFAAQAADRGVSPVALALAWVLAQPGVTAAILGPRRPEQLEPASEAVGLELTADEADALAALF
jgi:aryl-alcohol dehydrogenase-like predicted oxidoreductase